jgi:hypothetical protein
MQRQGLVANMEHGSQNQHGSAYTQRNGESDDIYICIYYIYIAWSSRWQYCGLHFHREIFDHQSIQGIIES